MSEESKCPKCDGKMKIGQLYVNATLDRPLTPSTSSTLMPLSSSMDLFEQIRTVMVEGPSWSEESDKEGGWLIKRKGKQTLSIKGMRCLECGYIELYVVK